MYEVQFLPSHLVQKVAVLPNEASEVNHLDVDLSEVYLHFAEEGSGNPLDGELLVKPTGRVATMHTVQGGVAVLRISPGAYSLSFATDRSARWDRDLLVTEGGSTHYFEVSSTPPRLVGVSFQRSGSDIPIHPEAIRDFAAEGPGLLLGRSFKSHSLLATEQVLFKLEFSQPGTYELSTPELQSGGLRWPPRTHIISVPPAGPDPVVFKLALGPPVD